MQTIIARRSELLEIEPDEPDMLHSVLCKIPKPLALETWIPDTMDLFRQYPPESCLRNWRSLSSSSVLKTTHDPAALPEQSLADGEKMFLTQQRQLRRAKQLQYLRSTMWVHRRRAGAFGFALLVAVLSYSFRDYGNSHSFVSSYMWLRRTIGG